MKEETTIDYTPELETLFLQFLVSNHELFVRSSSILKPEFFDDMKNRSAVSFIMEHSEKYSTMPSVEQIQATTGKHVTLIQDVAAKEDRWFLAEIEKFCRYKALREAILSSPDLLEKGRYGEVEKAIKTAVQIALVKDLGTDYYLNPKERLEALRDRDGRIPTGWRDVDDKLYGGLGRGEITIFAGQSGAGKSLFLQNLAVNWAIAGLNVVYLSLELSEKLCAMRIDSMHTGFDTKEVMKNIDDVHIKVCAIHKKSNGGSLRIKQLPNGCTSTDIRAFIKEYELQMGIKVDAILVDYLDLMMPTSVKVSPSDMFVKDKYVSEELRNLAVELDTLMISASQLNRGSYEEVEFDPSHIAGGISKVNTADNVVGIFTSAAMKESGRYQVQFMKTRSSAGVGSRVDLAFNNKSLRITDLEDGDDNATAATTKGIFEQLKKKSVVTQAPKPSDATSVTNKSDDVLGDANKIRSFLKRK